MKKSKISVLLLILLLGIACVFHATLPLVSSDTLGSEDIILKGHHEDTNDYCMIASDLMLSLTEILSMDDEQLKEEIIRQSQPMMLYRIKGEESVFWPRYEIKTSDLDFSQFKREASQKGMPVVYTLPSVTEGLVSQLQILVYVVDDTTPDSSSSSTEPSSTPGSSSTTESSSTTMSSTLNISGSQSSASAPVSEVARAELLTSSSSDIGNPLVGRTTSSISSSQSQLTTEQSITTATLSASDDFSDRIGGVHYSEGTQSTSTAEKVITASLGVVDGLTALAIVSDLRVILWYLKLKR